MPRVSVVIPTYNHAHFIGRAIQSVLDQTFTDWEALVVDNHSTDNTDQVLAGFADPRIRVLKIHNDGVIAASRNLGIRNATGEWIAFLDSDDCWFPPKLERLLAAAGAGADVVANDELTVQTVGGLRVPLHHGPYEPDFYRVLLVEGNRLSPSATMVRREFLAAKAILFDESPEFATVEDYGFWLDLARADARFVFVPEILGEFTIHPASSSAQVDRHIRNSYALMRRHVHEIQRFEPDRARLWRSVLPRLRHPEVSATIRRREIGRALRLALATLGEAPADSARYFASRLLRR